MRHIYDDKNPKLVDSIVCFVDILGFSNIVKEACRCGQGDQLLARLKSAIDSNIQFLKSDYDDHINLKLFTDNIVVGVPLYSDGESDLGGVMMGLASYQLNLALEGFFVRGGVTVGPYYGDDQMSFGESVIDAHDIENKVAIMPRIVLDTKAIAMVKKHMSYYSSVRSSPQSSDLLVDIDGQWFINYLEAAFEDGDDIDHKHVLDILYRHRDMVMDHLNRYRSNFKVFDKYQWVCNYHNFFCHAKYPKIKDLIIVNQQGFGQFSLIRI